MRKIYLNAIKTPDGTILVSEHRHDYKTHIDATNNQTYFVDGGSDYFRSSANGDETSLYIKEGDSFEDINYIVGDIRDYILWGTYGKNGDEDLKRKSISNLSNDHLRAILYTQHHLSDTFKDIILSEIIYRAINGIYIKD